MDVRLVEDFSRYEEFVRGFERTVLFASDKYRRFLSSILPAETRYLGAFEGEELRGVLPAFLLKTADGNILNSLPFYGSNGGTIGDDDKAGRILIAAFKDLAAKENCLSSTLVESPFDGNDPGRLELLSPDFVDRRVCQIAPLESESREETLRSFHLKHRNATRKPYKSGLRCVVDHSEKGWEWLFETHTLNINAVGGLSKPIEMFDALWAVFEPGRDYDIYFAEFNSGERAAALLVFYYNFTAEYYTPATVVEHRSLNPLNMLVLESMIHSKEKGMKYYNFGGTWATQDGVYRFKNRFGARDYPYCYYVNVYGDGLDRLREMGRDKILSTFPYFYVLPFGEL